MRGTPRIPPPACDHLYVVVKASRGAWVAANLHVRVLLRDPGEVDREVAIRRAIVEAGAGEIVLIAGKGHETTQEGADGLRHFDDREIARAALGVDR